MTDDEIEGGFPAAWYVAFYGEEKRWWWDRLSPSGFHHVLAFGYCAHAECWLVYDVQHGRSYVRALKTNAFSAWLASLPEHRKILHIETQGLQAPPSWRVGFWCTIAVAHLLGIPSRALRPVALYRDLMAHGARPAFEPEQAHDQEQVGIGG